MKNTANTVRTICEIGLFAALGFIFDELQGVIWGGVFPNGGSIGFAMIAVLIIAYRRGVLAGIATGFIMGLFDIATKAYVLHPAQVLLDYVLPYLLVGLAGIFRPFFQKAKAKESKIVWLIVGTAIGGLLKFVSHYLAGVIYWADPEYFAWNLNSMNPYLYCFIYNIAFIAPSIILTGGLLVVAFMVYPKILTEKPFIEEKDSERKNPVPAIVSGSLIALGAFLFIFFLIDWIKSFYYKESSQKYYFNQDSMVIYVIGIFLIVLGTISLISYFKNKFNYAVMSFSLVIITFFSWAYSIYKISEAVSEKEPINGAYWVWFAIAFVGFLGAIAFFILPYIKESREKQLED